MKKGLIAWLGVISLAYLFGCAKPMPEKATIHGMLNALPDDIYTYSIRILSLCRMPTEFERAIFMPHYSGTIGDTQKQELIQNFFIQKGFYFVDDPQQAFWFLRQAESEIQRTSSSKRGQTNLVLSLLLSYEKEGQLINGYEIYLSAPSLSMSVLKDGLNALETSKACQNNILLLCDKIQISGKECTRYDTAVEM